MSRSTRRLAPVHDGRDDDSAGTVAQAHNEPMTDPRAAKADALIDELRREGSGRLTIFLGAAPGVGKTYAMLSRARELQTAGCRRRRRHRRDPRPQPKPRACSTAWN